MTSAAVAMKLWQGGVLTEGQLDEAESYSVHYNSSEEVRSLNPLSPNDVIWHHTYILQIDTITLSKSAKLS